MTEKQKVSRVEVYWHTVKYRTVLLYGVLITAIILACIYLVFPSASSVVLQKLNQTFAEPETPVASPAARQARFVNLDGKVQVKKADSVQWVNADYQVTLDKGDLVQTGAEGVARISFADGTEYTVKGDSLVTVEENDIGQESTQVAVHITSGQVDLNTGGLSSGSKAEVSFENAVADLHSNSHAAVSSDPSTQQQQITVTSGSAELDRGATHMEIGQSERASFVTGQADITKTQVLAAPQLVEPLNLAPKFVGDPKTDPVHFSWKPVPTAKQYEFQASTTGIFNHVVKDLKTTDNFIDVAGLAPGNNFWRVRAIDDKNEISDPSDVFKFTLAVQGKNQDMLLTIDGTQLEGNSVEVMGRTEPGAILIINGEQVADIDSSGHFRYFTQPMTSGSHTIVITGQNRRGDTTIKRVDIVIP
ncbi:MAG TPA: hypothetical protein VJN69_11850 [Candidatus Acidoferrales bacterium]|nr:hypothetical protein [Candidatus Acidoferrales bacterium]